MVGCVTAALEDFAAKCFLLTKRFCFTSNSFCPVVDLWGLVRFGAGKKKTNCVRSKMVDALLLLQIPRVWKLVESVPRNAMGKVNKKQLVQLLFPDEVDSSG